MDPTEKSSLVKNGESKGSIASVLPIVRQVGFWVDETLVVKVFFCQKSQLRMDIMFRLSR